MTPPEVKPVSDRPEVVVSSCLEPCTYRARQIRVLKRLIRSNVAHTYITHPAQVRQ